MDKVVLVTGGSKGLGRAICKKLIAEGSKVAFNFSKSTEEAKSLIDETENSKNIKSFQASVTDKKQMNEMVRTIEATWGPVDILINNAGFGQVVPIALMEEEDWDLMIDTHVKGAFITSQAVLRGMIKKGKGKILNMSSLAGVKMMLAPVHYCAAKAALKGFTEGLAKEVGRYGITVNCLAPGILDEGVSQNLPENKLHEYLQHCALGRVGKVTEVAEMVAMMVSDQNSFMNGATLVLDGAV